MFQIKTGPGWSWLLKEMADLNWNEISNQLEVPVKDDTQKLAYLNKVELMKQFVNEQVKGKFKKIVNCKT